MDDVQLAWCEFVHSVMTHVADEMCGDFNGGKDEIWTFF